MEKEAPGNDESCQNLSRLHLSIRADMHPCSLVAFRDTLLYTTGQSSKAFTAKKKEGFI